MTKGTRLRPFARAVLRTQGDERLVALSREGREGAFEEIVRRYRPGLVAFAAAYAPPDRAEDVVQESLLASWNALRGTTEEIRLKPWLYTIVRNRALNARRDARPAAPLPDDLDGVAQPDEIVLGREQLAGVVAAVGALPQAQRQALVRSALDGHTHEQIASAIDASPGAVRQLIYRARSTVREGVGLAIPLPLVRALADAGGGEAVTGAVAGGAAVAGSAGGASALTKATVVAVVGTIAAGSGVAIKRASDRDGGGGARAEAAVTPPSGKTGSADATGDKAPAAGGPSAPSGTGTGGGGQGPERERDEDDEGSNPGRGSDDNGEAEDEDLDESGSGSGGSGSGGGHGGSGGGSGPSGSGASAGDDDPPSIDDTGGNPGSGSDSSGSGSGEVDSEDEVEPVEDDSSGFGSGDDELDDEPTATG